MYERGGLSYIGIGTLDGKPDWATAIRLLDAACAQNHAPSWVLRAQMYESG